LIQEFPSLHTNKGFVLDIPKKKCDGRTRNHLRRKERDKQILVNLQDTLKDGETTKKRIPKKKKTLR